MNTRKGSYGYLGDNLLMLASIDEGYEFTTNIKEIISEYNFKGQRSKYTGYISYRLKVEETVKLELMRLRHFVFIKTLNFS